MQLLKTLTASSYQDLIDYNVVDADGDHVGTLHALWSDHERGEIEFLGVKTGWLFGRNHVVPAAAAQIDAEEKYVKLPFQAEFIKQAPTVDADSEISEDQEQEILRYYRAADASGGRAPAAAGATLASSDPGSDMERALGATATNASATEPAPITTPSVSTGAVGDGYVATTSGDSVASARLRRTGNRPGQSGDENVTAVGGGGAAAGGVLPSATNAGSALGLDTSHPDPVSGETGTHPVGTGIGAASGAATGAAMGAAGGPVGALVGGIAGAVVGGLVGKGVEEYFDPTEETAYWRANYHRAGYHDSARSFEDYEPAYRTGFEGFGRVARGGQPGADFESVEPDLQRDYESHGAGRLEWERARHAARDAYERVRANVATREKQRPE